MWGRTWVSVGLAATFLSSGPAHGQREIEKPTVKSIGENIIITTPNDTVFELGTGADVDHFSMSGMITDIQDALNTLRESTIIYEELRDNLTTTMDQVTSEARNASDLVALALSCAERNLTLGGSGECISPAVTCPRVPVSGNITVRLSPEGLAYERLPGTIATFVCRHGHVDPLATRAHCTSRGTWSRPSPTECDPCSLHLPHCDVCGNGVCLQCRAPYVLNGTKCAQPITCADVQVTGEYTLAAGFDAFCLVADGHKWMKISSWRQTYPLSASSRNPADCATARGRDCKLSDRDINAVITAPSNERFYRLEADGRSNKIYIYTDRDYQDTTYSWGIVPRQAKAMVNEVFLRDELRYHAASFTQNYVDFYYVTDTAYRQTSSCERYFIGHGSLDCYANSRCRCRCIKGGSQCSLGRYAYIPDWSMYIAAV